MTFLPANINSSKPARRRDRNFSSTRWSRIPQPPNLSPNKDFEWTGGGSTTGHHGNPCEVSGKFD
ncbi:MAG: hypothetical protein NPIRA06_17460 [Nitrospirales bacterium]|nr:MAG: hypothetical protein NPIRA06_17460 [Nitrospirales bacterium]